MREVSLKENCRKKKSSAERKAGIINKYMKRKKRKEKRLTGMKEGKKKEE